MAGTDGSLPAVSSGNSGVLVAPSSAGSDPLAAVVAVASPTALAARGIAFDPPVTPTVVPTAAGVATPIATSTFEATASPQATATFVPSPTATPFPYVAARLTDILGESITSYAGSIATRAHNVQLATTLINGAKVAPGEVFSFDDVVGDQTTAHGFQVAWGIINGPDGTPETVKADAGGICQVATTVFQAAYWSGLPFVRRFHHLYWIAHYGTPPYGAIGLDATVDFAPVDLQFRNTTTDWVRLDMSYDSTHVHAKVMGVSQGWTVTVGTPKVFNVLKTDRTLVRRPDPTMPPGQELYVEAPQDGFDVTVERLVKSQAGELVDHYVFTNHYEQAHNVMVYGTKGLPPPGTPGPVTPTAVAAVATPVATPTSAAPVPTAVATKPADGRIAAPSVVGLPEAQARSLISNSGLQNSFTNYQGPSDVPASVLNQVPVGAVLSQNPPGGTLLGPGSTVYIAVRKA